MAQPVAHRRELANALIQLVGFGRKRVPIDARPAARRERFRDLFEREAGRAAERDQSEPLEHARVELPAQAASADRGDESDFLVEPQRRGGNAGLPRDLGDIQFAHVLDFKWT